MTDKTVVETTEKLKEELKKTTDVPEVDYQKQIEEKNALIAKITEDRDSYKQGVKKWQDIARGRGINPEDFPEEEKIAVMVEQKVQEHLKSSQITDLIKERDALIAKQALELSEARLALKNRPPQPTADANQDKGTEVKTDFFTKEQLDDLKKRGVDPQKVIENMRRQQGN